MSARSSPAAPAATPGWPSPLSTFPIKDVRQGLRTYLWMGEFLGLQTIVTLIALAHLVGDPADTGPNVFWTPVAVTLLALQPVRAYLGLVREMARPTSELVQLTPMTPWQIVAGKWIAHMVQTALLVAPLFPHLALRYFVVGSDPRQEMLFLAILIALCAIITAMALSLAAVPGVLARMALIAGISWCVFYEVNRYLRQGVLGFAYRPLEVPDLVTGTIAATALFLVPFIWELACQQMAPPALRRPWRLRAITMAGVVVAAASSYLLRGTVVSGALFTLGLYVLVVAAFSIGCEEEQDAAAFTSYRPFARWPAVPLLRELFCPGWVALVPFVPLTLASTYAVVMSLAWWLDGTSFSAPLREIWLSFALMLGHALLFPFAIARLLFPRGTGPKIAACVVGLLAVQIALPIGAEVWGITFPSPLGASLFYSAFAPASRMVIGYPPPGGNYVNGTMLVLEILALVMIDRELGTTRRQMERARRCADSLRM